MVQDTYDPLTEYINVFRDKFKDVAKSTFAQLAKEAQVDVEANRETCRQIYATEEGLSSIKAHIGWWKVLCVILWLGVFGALIWVFVAFQDASKSVETWIIAVMEGMVMALLFLFVHPKLKELKGERDNLEENAFWVNHPQLKYNKMNIKPNTLQMNRYLDAKIITVGVSYSLCLILI